MPNKKPMPSTLPPMRLIVIDDNRAIHEDVRKVLCADSSVGAALDDLEADLFGAPTVVAAEQYRLDSAFQGEDGLELVRRALAAGDPYAVALVDVRMPPGWDGIETVERIWKECPELQVIICTAYSDHSWTDIIGRLGRSDSMLILKKPFDPIELLQMTSALGRKWLLHREDRAALQRMNADLARTNGLLHREIEDRQRVEVKLRLAQKLEAVGQLASGIAHEINTPVQFVTDSVHFVRESLPDVLGVLAAHQRLRQAETGAAQGAAAAEVAAAEAQADLPYLLVNLPAALDRSLEGLARIATIVHSMNDFAHPEQTDMSSVDLNQGISSTLVIAANEFKLVAKLETDLGDLPPVLCHAGEVNQVLLNLILNAAHAIGAVVKDTGQMGRITVKTRHEGQRVLVSIADTGGGIPEEIRDRVFDPFFTTKEVGRGTGQGLAIARSIVESHGGELTFDTEIGRGTTFFIRLPIEGTGRPESAAA